MAAQEHLECIRQGTVVWNRWRRNHPERKPDLSGISLSGLDLSGSNLSRADLSNTDLSNALLRNVNLSYADLGGANLFAANLVAANLLEANLFGANLIAADLSYADLGGANLSKAQLNRADLSSAVIRRTIFGDVDLRHVKGLETIKHDGPSTVSIDTLIRSRGDISTIFLKGVGMLHGMIEHMKSMMEGDAEYATYLISYCQPDLAFVEQLMTDLQRHGVRCRYAENMNSEVGIQQRIDDSIHLYDKLILVLSEHAMANNWVAYQVERAFQKEPQGIPNVIYPLRLDQAILTSDAFWGELIKRTRSIGDFEQWKDPVAYQRSLQRLLHTLQPQSINGDTNR